MTFSESNLFRDDSLEEENAFDVAAEKTAEAKESIMGTDEEREERERINEEVFILEVFQNNIFRRLKHASLWFQFHFSFDCKIDRIVHEKLL